MTSLNINSSMLLYWHNEIENFICELHLFLGPKNDPPMIVQEKVLSLIQSWADAFYNQPDMSPVVQIYRDLKAKGIEFPMTDLDAMAPIHTPQKVSVVIIKRKYLSRLLPLSNHIQDVPLYEDFEIPCDELYLV